MMVTQCRHTHARSRQASVRLGILAVMAAPRHSCPATCLFPSSDQRRHWNVTGGDCKMSIYEQSGECERLRRCGVVVRTARRARTGARHSCETSSVDKESHTF